ncbi:Bax inhibitor 1-related like protein [Aduncisulcus paluster]|uniref:Bax inhibitor 1-related like protein n=1 Tax=Aduncisulcus paluster TaxID=2918883 RepID=A0ABQ5KLZ2_9EUKA|nr:Bax inhibitor 1-related like protein [Aduncisulcus paluster]
MSSGGASWSHSFTPQSETICGSSSLPDTEAEIVKAAKAMNTLVFFRKVYGLLSICCGIPLLVCVLFRGATVFVQNNIWLIITAAVGTLGFFITLYFVHKSYPMNLLFLFLFVGCGSILLGCLTAYYESIEIVASIAITLSLTVGMAVMALLSSPNTHGPPPESKFPEVLILYVAVIAMMWFWWDFSAEEIYYSCSCSIMVYFYILFYTIIIARFEDDCIIAVSRFFVDIITLMVFLFRVIYIFLHDNWRECFQTLRFGRGNETTTTSTEMKDMV